MEGEVAGALGRERGEHALAATLVEECLVAEENVAGAQGCGRGDFAEEAVGRGERLERCHDVAPSDLRILAANIRAAKRSRA
jgi:hypothetical protein